MRSLRLSRKPASDPIATIEAEITSLTATKAQLEARLPALEAAKADALAKRRESLIGGAGSDAEADAHRAAREAESNLEAVTDALAEVERRLADGVERLASTRDQASRDAIADELERDSAAVDAAAERVRQAVVELAKAKDALATAITPLAAPMFAASDYPGDRKYEPPAQIAVHLTGYLIALSVPELTVSEATRSAPWRGGYISEKPIKAENGPDPASALLTGPMRDAAAQIRAGAMSAELRRWEEPEPDFTPSPDEVMVYVIQPFTYKEREVSHPDIVSVNQKPLIEPLAKLAIARGFASATKPKDWELHFERWRNRTSGRPLSIVDVPELGFVVEDWKQTEREKARAAWLAERKRAAA